MKRRQTPTRKARFHQHPCPCPCPCQCPALPLLRAFVHTRRLAARGEHVGPGEQGTGNSGVEIVARLLSHAEIVARLLSHAEIVARLLSHADTRAISREMPGAAALARAS